MKTFDRNDKQMWIPGDVVRQFFPRVTEEQANDILWNMTAFPMDSAEGTERMLRELAVEVRPRKRGWLRRIAREARRIEADMHKAAMAHEAAEALSAPQEPTP